MDKEGFHEYLARISRRSFSAGSPVTRPVWISTSGRTTTAVRQRCFDKLSMTAFGEVDALATNSASRDACATKAKPGKTATTECDPPSRPALEKSSDKASYLARINVLDLVGQLW